MAEQRDLGPATPGLSHQRQAEAVRIVRDVLAGTARLRERAEEYLPRFPKEVDEVYGIRKATAVLFNATKRTNKAFAGLVFRKELTIPKEIPDDLRTHLENVDLAGRDVTAFAQDHFEDAYADGHACIFVDMQPPAEADSLAAELAQGIRPYWLNVRKQDVLAFGVASVGGQVVLTDLRFRETVTERMDRWREVEVHRIREYFLGPDEDGFIRVAYRVWQLDTKKQWPGEGSEDWTVVEEGTMTRTSIPLAVTYTNREGYLESTPPFLDLAYHNLLHFQTDSDNQNLARTAKVQTLVFKGESEERINTVAIGPGNAIVLENENADAVWIGADGSSFSVFLDALTKIEQRMAVMGLSQLMNDTRAAETAQSKRIDKAESDSQLAAAAKNLERALNSALELHAEWLDIEDPGGRIGVNTDFETEPLDSATFREIRELWAERGLSWRTLMEVVKKGELMPESFDIDEERERIDEEVGSALEDATARLFGPATEDEDDEEEEDDDPEADAAA